MGRTRVRRVSVSIYCTMLFVFFNRKTWKLYCLFQAKTAETEDGRRDGGRGEKTAGHSTGNDMDSVAEFVLRRKTRPGMPSFENDGRPMNPG